MDNLKRTGLIPLTFLLGALAGCGDAPATVSDSDSASAPADYSDPVVLMVSPDSLEIERMEERLGDDFYVVADDAMWYRANALQMLDSLGIRHLDVRKGEARFQMGDETRVFSWRDQELAWFLVLYNGTSIPKVAADIDLPYELDYLQPDRSP